MSDLVTPLTLAELSRHYLLPEGFLRALGLSDGPDGVRTPFLDSAGKPQTTLRRTSLTEPFATGWPAGQRRLPWGLWCLPRARMRGQLFVVFTEPDAWVLWHHALPALALPDPTCLESEFLTGNVSVVIQRRPSDLGNQQVERVRVRLLQLDHGGRVCDLRLLNGHASLADLYRAAPQEFNARLMEALHDARSLQVRAATQPTPAGIMLDYEKRWPSRLYLQPASVCGPLHPGAASLDREPELTTPAAAWDERAWLQSQAPEKLLYYLGHERGDAMRFLQTELSTGPKSAQVLLHAARAQGLSSRTLRRAKKLLAVRSQRRGLAAGAGQWVWSLPGG